MRCRRPELFVVIGSLSRGGCERHLLQVLPRLVARGYGVSVFLLDASGPLAADMEAGDVELIKPWWGSNELGRLHFLIRFFRLGVVGLQLLVTLWRKRPHIIMFFLPASYLIGAPVSLLVPGIKRIMSRRSLNDYQKGYPWFVRMIEIWLHRRMDAMLGNSVSVVRQLLQEENAAKDRVGLIYNGVHSTKHSFGVRAKARDELGVAPNTVVIAVVANLIPYKGHADLLKAVVQLKCSSSEEWRLFLAGRDDGYGAELRRQTSELRLDDNVVFLGEYTQIELLLAASDMFVLPSHQEGFSNALLEAMGAGLGIVATDVGGNAEAVVDGVSGLIVPPRDSASLAQAIVRLANNPQERRRFGAAACERAQQVFSIERCLTQYDSCLRSVHTEGRLPRNVKFEL